MRSLAGLAIAFVALASQAHAPARADGALAIAGDVRDEATSAAIAGATLRVTRADGTTLASATTDARGTFALSAADGPDERLDVVASGYAKASLPLSGRRNLGRLRVALEPPALRDIVRTTARATRPSLTSTVATAASLTAAGALRVSDQVQKLPGLTATGDGLAPGGDAYLSLRGLRPSEGQALLDGHPIGPIGVAIDPPDADGVVAGFNYQDAPLFALRSTSATFGSSARPSFGIAALGGSIDLETLQPTRAFEATAQQAFGNEGRAFTAFRATGTTGPLGYALAYGVSGTYGLFRPATIAQTGLRGTDQTTATLRTLTYPVSGDYVERNALLKLSYASAPRLAFGFSAYSATSWTDKTGEGDNDANPYGYELANAPVGADPSCPGAVAVRTDAGLSCESAAAYARASSGPAGGGPDATQALIDTDYDADVRARAGRFDLKLDAFADRYALLYDREASALSGPADVFDDRFRTGGLALDASFAAKKNDAGLDVAVLTQTLDGNGTTFDDATLAPLAPNARTVRSALFTDAYAPDGRLAFDARALVSSSDANLRLDPSARVTYRPTVRDSFSLAAGRVTEDPSLTVDRVQLSPIGALNPDCGAIAGATEADPAFVDVGTGPAANLHAETASDGELDFAHVFGENDRVKVTLYGADVTDRIVTAQTPAGSQLPLGALAPLDARIASFCGLAAPPGAVQFTLARSFNAATAELRGIEIAGSATLVRHVSLDYASELQSIVLNGLPASVLRTDPTLVNGAQAFSVPRTKSTLGVTFASAAGLTLELDGHAVGANNPQQLPGYAYADASVAERVGPHATLDVRAGNVFNSHAQQYGLTGLGVPYATNAFFADQTSPFSQESNERYGLPPVSLSASATFRL